MTANSPQNGGGSGGPRDRRRHSRHELPVVVTVSTISELPLVPEDVSAGGIRLTVSKAPAPVTEVDCAIQFAGATFRISPARVVWIRPNEDDPPTWSVGLSMDLPDREREEFEAAVRESRIEDV